MDSSNMEHDKIAENPRLALLWNVFLARKDAYMEQTDSWLCIKREVTKADIVEHLAGHRRLGSYLISTEGKVPYLVYDFDSHDKPEAKPDLKAHILPLAHWLRKQGMGTFIEDTGGFGYHLWVPFHDEIYASRVIKFAKHALKEANIFFDPEIFPKQAKLEPGKFGNGIRLPWGRHTSGEWSHFLEDNFEIDDDNAIKGIKNCRSITWKILEELLPQRAKTPYHPTKAGDIAAGLGDAVILEGSRHNTLFSMGCGLRAKRFSPEKVLTALRNHNEAHCSPPLDDKEIQEIYKGVLKQTNIDITAITDKESQADTLVKISLDKAELFHSPELRAYARFANSARNEIWALRSHGFRQWLSREAYMELGKVPYSEAINTALFTLEGIAIFDKQKKPLNLRVGWQDDTLWYDLGDWQAVKATKAGWSVEDPPILFRHYSHQVAQVHPEPGHVHDFLRFVNIESEGDKALLLTYLVVSFVPDIPQPILFIHGDQGSGKSQLLRLMRDIIDPSLAGLLTIPDNLREFGQLGHHHRTVYLDNVHNFPTWLVEGFSRLATGASFTKRALFTDEDDVLFSNKGLGGFTAVSFDVDAPDLLDRALFFKLKQIPPDKRKSEKELLTEFSEAKPRILGGIFTVLSKAMAVKETLSLERKPRMADFYIWGRAVAQVLDLHSFEAAFWHNINYQSEQALEASIIAPAIEKLMTKNQEWSGASAELLKELSVLVDEEVRKLRAWPKEPQWLSRKLHQIIPNLAQLGIQVDKDKRTWSLRRIRENSVDSAPAFGVKADDKKVVSAQTSFIAPTSDAKDGKGREDTNIAPNSSPKLEDARNANIASPSKGRSPDLGDEEPDVFLPSGRGIQWVRVINLWKRNGGGIVSPHPSIVIWNLEEEIRDLPLDVLGSVVNLLEQDSKH